MKCRKNVAWLLAVAILFLLTACSNPAENLNEEISAYPILTSAYSEEENADQRYVCDLPELNYENEKVAILFAAGDERTDEFVSENLGGGLISDAVYERNLAVENELEVELQYVKQGEGTDVQTLVQSGDRSLEIFVLDTWVAIPLALRGCYLDLNTIDYLDLSKHYWIQDYNDIMTFTTDGQQFLATSPASLSLFRLAYLTIFNRELFESYHIPSLYETVDNGDWTLDYQYSISSNVYADSDGDGARDADDFYGLIVGSLISVDGYCVSSDIDLIARDDDGAWVYNDNVTEKFISMAEKVNQLFFAPGTYISSQDNIGEYAIIEKFADQQGLMATTQFLSVEKYIAPLTELSYGIVPMPKLTVEQEGYYTYVQDQVSAFGVSAAIGDDNRQAMLGAVLESLAHHSYDLIRPAYYDSAMSLRFMQDPQSSAILNTMFKSLSFDFGSTTNIGKVRTNLRALLPNKSFPVSSTMRAMSLAIKRELQNMEQSIQNITD